MAGSFFDTNVLLYVASADAVKATQAEVLIRRGGAISVQVLNEVTHVARRKMRFSWAETRAFLDTLRALLIVHPLTAETHDMALGLAERYRLAIYDAVIAAAALGAGCDTLFSEDMQHGQVLGGSLRVENPFRSSDG